MIQQNQVQLHSIQQLMQTHRHRGTRLNHRATVDHLIPILMTLLSQVVVTLEEVVQVVTGKDESFCQVLVESVCFL